MARARNIKPAIMANEELAELPALTRLLFIYLWMLADRDGRLQDRAKRIAAQALPYDRAADVEEMLAQLHAGGFIARFSAAGHNVIQITNFLKHQNPHGTEKDGELPDANGLFTVHERGKSGYATGAVRFKDDADQVIEQVSNVKLTVNSRPDSLIPDLPTADSLIPDRLIHSAPIGAGGTPPLVPPPPPPTHKVKTEAEQEQSRLWTALKATLVEQKACANHKDAGVLLGKHAAKYGKDVFIEAARQSLQHKPVDLLTYLVGLCETAAGKRQRLGGPMSDAQREDVAARETAEGKRLLLARRAGGDVIDGEVQEVSDQRQIGGAA